MTPVTIGDATLYLGDCVAVMAGLPANSVAAIVCDPPYLLNFMGKAFDQQHKALPGANEGQKMQAWHGRWVAEAFRILKPGGYLAAFGGDRTHHRLLAAMEDAGFEPRQNLYFCFGSGFPKSQDAGKALDRKAGAVRAVVGAKADPRYLSPRVRGFGADANGNTLSGHGPDHPAAQITAPATPAAQRWNGWGTALKPAVEIICVGRKPMVGTLADNLLAWGTGAINIDATRVGTDANEPNARKDKHGLHKGELNANKTVYSGAWRCKDSPWNGNTGRFPAHLLHDGSPSVVAMFPVTGNGYRANPSFADSSDSITGWNHGWRGERGHNDTGSAARFFQSCPYDADDFAPLFYSGKAAKRDRDEGCGGLEPGRNDWYRETSGFNKGPNERNGKGGTTNRTLLRNHHVSVKPTALMRWLIRLFVPPGETVLDPFLGSGSTLKAALLENKTGIGIEMDPDYFAIAVERIKHVSPASFELQARA